MNEDNPQTEPDTTAPEPVSPEPAVSDSGVPVRDSESTASEPHPPASTPQGPAPAAESAAESATESAAESATESATETESAPVAESAAEPVSAPAPASGNENENETGNGTAIGTEPASENATATKSAPPKKKKRKKKKPAKPATTGAFGHHFKGGPRKHAFSTGEIVAGRVARVSEGAVVVDLFGKALAVADVDEPREVPAPVVDETPKSATREADTWPGKQAKDIVPELAVSEPEAASETAAAAATETESAAEPVSAAALASGTGNETGTETGTGNETGDANETETGNETENVTGNGIENVNVNVTGTGNETETRNETGTETASETDTPQAPPDMSVLEPLPELEVPTEGSIFRGRVGSVSESGHIALVNRIVDRAQVKKAIVYARDQKQRVQGVVYGFNRGGFDVMVSGVRVFCPASGMSLKPITDPETFIGKRLTFALPQNKTGKKSIVVSRRNLLEKEARKQARERMKTLKVGDKIDGTVTEIRDYGVLVDLGDGLDGLVHMSEVSWNRGDRAADVVSVGDPVKVEVLKLQPATRKDRYGRVSLSLRSCAPDPWDEHKERLKPGQHITGKVVRTTDFGAFIEIAPGVEGLVHISELGGKELTHAKQALNEGDAIEVVVERVDKGQRRISLSKLSEQDKQALEAGEFDPSLAPKSLKPGTHVSVVVKRVEHAGVRVQVQGVLGRRGRGFLRKRDLADGDTKGPAQGDVIEVKIVGTDRDGTLKCSVRGRQLDDERKAVREYRKEAAKQGLGTFGDLLKAKLDSDDAA